MKLINQRKWNDLGHQGQEGRMIIWSRWKSGEDEKWSEEDKETRLDNYFFFVFGFYKNIFWVLNNFNVRIAKARGFRPVIEFFFIQGVSKFVNSEFRAL
jgi:hypothetical protein